MRDSCPYSLCLIAVVLALLFASGEANAQQRRFIVTSGVANAEVRIDGVKIGETDLNGRFEDNNVEPGLREIAVSKAGYKSVNDTRRFSSVLDTHFQADLDLLMSNLDGIKTTDLVSVSLQSSTASASVFVDNMYVGRTDESGQMVLRVPPGQRKFSVSSSFTGLSEKSVPLKQSTLIQLVRVNTRW